MKLYYNHLKVFETGQISTIFVQPIVSDHLKVCQTLIGPKIEVEIFFLIERGGWELVPSSLVSFAR